MLFLCVALWNFFHPPAYASYGEACGGEVYLTGRVYAKESKNGNRPVLSLFIEPDALIFQNQEIPFKDNFICTMQENADVPIGSTVVVRGILREYEPATNPGQFDAGLYYATLHISGRLQKTELLASDGKMDALREGLWVLKNRLSLALDVVFSEEDAAILKAMLLGDKTSMDAGVKTLYREAGILHILAISGLHISLLGMGLFQILRKCRLPNIPASVLCGIGMIFYGMLTGMPVSAVRAISMFLLRLLAGCLGRTYDMLTALAVCGASMLLGQPLYLYHSGFLLSYLAVLAILLLKPALLPERWKKNPLADAFFTTLSVSLFTLPVQLFFFYEVSVYAVFLNLAVVPLVGVVMVLGMSGMAAYFCLAELAVLFRLPVRGILASYETGAAFVRGLPGSVWTPGKPALWQIAGCCLLFGIVILCGKLAWRYRMGLLCGVVLLLSIRCENALRVTFLDVGQGDCVCVELPEGGVWLFDGGSTGVSDVGTYRITPFLKSRGITVLDAVFLSHEDADHINGVEELLQAGTIEIELLVLPYTAKKDEKMFVQVLKMAAKKDIPVLWMKEGMSFKNGGVSARCLHPGERFDSKDGNAASLVVYLTYGEFSLLLTGDVEESGEEALLSNLQQQQIEQVTLLKAAHHGSRNASGEQFLQIVRPLLTVISAGKDNVYGHPHEETLERLSRCGTRVYQTTQSGAVTVTVWKDKIRIEEENAWND